MTSAPTRNPSALPMMAARAAVESAPPRSAAPRGQVEGHLGDGVGVHG